MQTQVQRVLTELKRGRILTPVLAYHQIGTMRLAAIIHVLRNRGYNILTEIKETKDGKQYAAYKMVKGAK